MLHAHKAKTYLVNGLLFAVALSTNAHTDKVERIHVTRAFPTGTSFLTDSTDVNGKTWNKEEQLLKSVANLSAWKNAEETTDSVLVAPESDAVRMIGFYLQNTNFAKVKINVSGIGAHKVFVDGKESTDVSLTPGRHEVTLKVLQKAGKSDTLQLSIQTDQEVVINPTGKAPYSLETLMNGERMGGVNLSADGQFLTLDKSMTDTSGKTNWTKYLVNVATGQRTAISDFWQWTSKQHTYIALSHNANNETVYESVDAKTGERKTLYTSTDRERGTILPGEKLMLLNKSTQGPKEDKEVFQVLTPDDRQAGWRDRNNVTLIDLESGMGRTLTQGQHNVYATLSPDGTKAVLNISENDITKRPFSFTTLVLLDLQSMQADTLVAHDGFISRVEFSPDGTQIAVQGSAEAFDGIGIRLPEGMTPSMIEQDLFLVNLQTKEVTPLTADFAPSIMSQWTWNKGDGMIYALCENRDNQDIFRINPKTKKSEMLKLKERFVLRFSVAQDKPALAYYGQGHSNSDRLYIVDLKSGKETLIEDLDKVRMKDIELGEFGDWNFRSERGDTIYGRYYLPPHFDASKKYPMLVYYYGGCSPVGRYLDSYYSYHGWAAMGYVVYVVQPSGASGFGQEFAARHVNAYGDYSADDIIQGTKKFCEEHPFVNKDKIGCLGASYGGFMTQYLQTQTDIFAAAVSHAGISDPTSYWGFGYWGFSYNAVAAANSYPWNNKQLFTEHAPLSMADKIHTPILFMHGNADTNVPINESVQMFTALKILGRECAFVTVDGQNHFILDYQKRIKWQNTIYAWFQKWLKDDPTWWETMYPTKNLK